jgi:hypothetical protein
MSVTQEIKKRSDEILLSIKSIDQFRKEDTMVDMVFKIGKEIYKTPLDRASPTVLISHGSHLAGAYAYIGQKSARARAERDVFEQSIEEQEKALMLKFLDSQYKVTEARAEVAAELAEAKSQLIMYETVKNQWEAIEKGCSTMLSFVQSAIKMKENERFINKNNQ